MKSISQLQTESDIKGMHSIGARSIPKSMRSSYLELYVLDRERARLEKEQFSTDKKWKNAQRRLDNLAVRMQKLLKEINEEKEVADSALRRQSYGPAFAAASAELAASATKALATAGKAHRGISPGKPLKKMPIRY
jgi:hypothetical protein